MRCGSHLHGAAHLYATTHLTGAGPTIEERLLLLVAGGGRCGRRRRWGCPWHTSAREGRAAAREGPRRQLRRDGLLDLAEARHRMRRDWNTEAKLIQGALR